jgi:hypothetical protein
MSDFMRNSSRFSWSFTRTRQYGGTKECTFPVFHFKPVEVNPNNQFRYKCIVAEPLTLPKYLHYFPSNISDVHYIQKYFNKIFRSHTFKVRWLLFLPHALTCTLPAECNHVFHIILKINSDCLPELH